MNQLIDNPLYSSAFLAAGVVTMLLELAIPSGGVLGVVSLLFTAFAAYGFFHQGHPLLASALVAAYVAALWGGFRLMVRRQALRTVLGPDSTRSVDARIEGLVGKDGIAATPLRPAGVAVIGGQRVDVVTRGDFLEKDAAIVVVDNSGNRVVVRRKDGA